MATDTGPKSFDELVTNLERGFDRLANQVMGTDEFSQGMNVLQNTRLGLRQAVQEAMQAHLERVNMPSREDLLRLGEQVHDMDKRMRRIERLLGRIAHHLGENEPIVHEAMGTAVPATSSAVPRPPRTRKPPSQRGGED